MGGFVTDLGESDNPSAVVVGLFPFTKSDETALLAKGFEFEYSESTDVESGWLPS